MQIQRERLGCMLFRLDDFQQMRRRKKRTKMADILDDNSRLPPIGRRDRFVPGWRVPVADPNKPGTFREYFHRQIFVNIRISIDMKCG